MSKTEEAKQRLEDIRKTYINGLISYETFLKETDFELRREEFESEKLKKTLIDIETRTKINKSSDRQKSEEERSAALWDKVDKKVESIEKALEKAVEEGITTSVINTAGHFTSAENVNAFSKMIEEAQADKDFKIFVHDKVDVKRFRENELVVLDKPFDFSTLESVKTVNFSPASAIPTVTFSTITDTLASVSNTIKETFKTPYQFIYSTIDNVVGSAINGYSYYTYTPAYFANNFNKEYIGTAIGTTIDDGYLPEQIKTFMTPTAFYDKDGYLVSLPGDGYCYTPSGIVAAEPIFPKTIIDEPKVSVETTKADPYAVVVDSFKKSLEGFVFPEATYHLDGVHASHTNIDAMADIVKKAILEFSPSTTLQISDNGVIDAQAITDTPIKLLRIRKPKCSCCAKHRRRNSK